MLRRLARTGVLALLAAALLAGSASGATTYEPPFALGPSGGDDFNMVQAEEAGRVTVARAYPHPGGIGCEGRAGYARLEVTHVTSTPIEAVEVAFTEAAVDPYAFVVADVQTADGTYLGSQQRRGLIAGDDALTVPVDWPEELLEDTDEDEVELTIQFGLQLSGACPAVDAGTLRFTTVTVHERATG